MADPAPKREVTPMGYKCSRWFLTIFEHKISRDRLETLRNLAFERGWSTESFTWEQAPTTGSWHCHVALHTPERPRKKQVVDFFDKVADVQKMRKVPAAAVAYANKSEGEGQDALISDVKVVVGTDQLFKLWREWSLDNEYISDDAGPTNLIFMDTWREHGGSLKVFDMFVNCMIREGYRGVESLAVNPQVRKAVKLYAASLLTRG